MGLFSRSNPSEHEHNETYSDLELPSSRDITGDPFSPPEDKATASPIRASRNGYGIEEAIRLMQALPRDNNEVVVTVVKKTLESAKIRVEDIIDDANAREERIRSEHKNLEAEIKELEAQIAKRNQQISALMDDQKCTADVRQRLQLALQLDKPARQQPAAPQAAETPPAAAKPAAAAEQSAPAATRPAAERPEAATVRTEPVNRDTPRETTAGTGSPSARRRAAQRGAQ